MSVNNNNNNNDSMSTTNTDTFSSTVDFITTTSATKAETITKDSSTSSSNSEGKTDSAVVGESNGSLCIEAQQTQINVPTTFSSFSTYTSNPLVISDLSLNKNINNNHTTTNPRVRFANNSNQIYVVNNIDDDFFNNKKKKKGVKNNNNQYRGGSTSSSSSSPSPANNINNNNNNNSNIFFPFSSSLNNYNISASSSISSKITKDGLEEQQKQSQETTINNNDNNNVRYSKTMYLCPNESYSSYYKMMMTRSQPNSPCGSNISIVGSLTCGGKVDENATASGVASSVAATDVVGNSGDIDGVYGSSSSFKHSLPNRSRSTINTNHNFSSVINNPSTCPWILRSRYTKRSTRATLLEQQRSSTERQPSVCSDSETDSISGKLVIGIGKIGY